MSMTSKCTWLFQVDFIIIVMCKPRDFLWCRKFVDIHMNSVEMFVNCEHGEFENSFIVNWIKVVYIIMIHEIS